LASFRGSAVLPAQINSLPAAACEDGSLPMFDRRIFAKSFHKGL